MALFISIIIAYFIGALPFDWWVVTKPAYRLRPPSFSVLNRREAFVLIVIDLVKGMAATLIGFSVAGWMGAYLAAVAVVVGSLYSVFLGFRGGTGIGVAAGALLILSPLLILIGILIYLFSLLTTRVLFVSTLLTTTAMIIFAVVLATQIYVWMVIIVVGGLILYRIRPKWKRIKRFEPPYRFRNPFRLK
ncbi:glycerol-3-phosphate acyltransferase [Thermoactinomyces sp. CICC 10522]|uniref:glycerol-3-phosphate acyltransferase n=1 Tax=Thermoactinomyces sp. CICC 10522 TaxID=2767427 RepID=UPI0018DE0083|nr:glycerol-3-phosphate acyltransferase [Thermoactinomyces sp. CICC 10522]MBH8604629.1 glycerol-3-phosphate acyltransferase [Thermoactinomyces sp. CICC 10522]